MALYDPPEREREEDREEFQPTGVGEANYSGPEDGPFRCGMCVHFIEPNECIHPKVVEGPTHGKVKAGGCCRFYRKA